MKTNMCVHVLKQFVNHYTHPDQKNENGHKKFMSIKTTHYPPN